MKKLATLGTRSFSLDRSGAPAAWCATMEPCVSYGWNPRVRVWTIQMKTRPVGRRRTVIVYDFFDIFHDFSISTLGNTRHLVDRLAIRLKNSGWLRMKNKRYCQQALRTYFSKLCKTSRLAGDVLKTGYLDPFNLTGC